MSTILEKTSRKSARRSLTTLKPKSVSQFAPEKKHNKKEIAFLTSYPPRECGIATYSQDLITALKNKFGKTFKFTIYPLESQNDSHQYPKGVQTPLNTDWELDFLAACRNINANERIGLVMIQHEFGLFKNNEGPFLDFLQFLDRPIIITFHTVLPTPDVSLRTRVKLMSEYAVSLVVMTERSAEILREDYDIPASKIEVIPHGTHLVAYQNKGALKKNYRLQGKFVLSTFGLLGPGKSIETTLDALPDIVALYPQIVFLIIGRTHPTLVKEEGEQYREFLTSKVEALGLQNHVRFINEFVPTSNLLEYLQLTDIYLFTSKDPHQAVSGTFVYAMSCGAPIISTPIPHAIEVLQNGAGTVFDFCDSEKLKANIFDLIRNNEKRQDMRLNGLHTSVVSSWENTAIAHALLFEKVLKMKVRLHYRRPAVKVSHIKKMTTSTGIIQFSKINQPDLYSGYTLDDNARALIAMCRHYLWGRDHSDLKYIKIYASFIFSCLRNNGRFMNYVDREFYFTEQNRQENLDDACGRAIWALGYLISVCDSFPESYRNIKDKAIFVFDQAISAYDSLKSPRAMAFAIKGMYHFSKNSQPNPNIRRIVTEYADKLANMYGREAHTGWNWFEGYLTYANSVLPHALLMAYTMTGNTSYRELAKESFDFLLSKLIKNNSTRVISNQGWLHRGMKIPVEYNGGEQPIDVAYTVLALDFFRHHFPGAGYSGIKRIVFNWFLGANTLNQIVYNPSTGGCYDGLEKKHANLNQGAESTLCYLLARLTFEELESE